MVYSFIYFKEILHPFGKVQESSKTVSTNPGELDVPERGWKFPPHGWNYQAVAIYPLPTAAALHRHRECRLRYLIFRIADEGGVGQGHVKPEN